MHAIKVQTNPDHKDQVILVMDESKEQRRMTMKNPMTMKSWSPYVVGIGIGVLSWFAFGVANNPLGISTAFEHTAALAEKAVAAQPEQINEYFLQKAEAGKSPKIGFGWMLVAGVFVGAFLSSWLSGDRSTENIPAMWRERFGGSVSLRLAAAFFAGALMMFGARLADGCTSGHGISGSLQLAVSSWVFTAVFFAAATVTALALYGRTDTSHV